ncbi:hypothetical protein [Streptosporangium sp. NPDC000396]|uniref:hypothetical protein n=1 Tax=Streptosporangium sp. NPDC000396 TaxID=3366185 RepID=UPI00367842FC
MGWLIIATLVTGVSIAVIGLLGEPQTASKNRPFPSNEIDEALVRATPMATILPTPAPAEPYAGPSQAFRSRGGIVIARCEAGLVILRAWSPAPNFHIKSVDRGPGRRGRIEFESDRSEVNVEVLCSPSGLPVHKVTD